MWQDDETRNRSEHDRRYARKNKDLTRRARKQKGRIRRRLLEQGVKDSVER